MNYQNKLKRHACIISILAQKNASFDSIRDRVCSRVEDIEEYNLRTFQRDIKEIAAIFQIPIKFNKYHLMYEIENSRAYHKSIESLNILTSDVRSYECIDTIQDKEMNGLGTIHLDEITYAIKHEYGLIIQYQKYSSLHTTDEREVLPLVLKENNNRWYVIAEDIHKGELRIFGLDRIVDLRLDFKSTKSRFLKEEIKERWSSSLGITFPNARERAEEVVLRFDQVIGPYVKSLPWHHSQKILSENNSEVLISLHVLIDNYLINKIFSCSNHIKVLEPLGLKNTIHDKLKLTISNYE